MFDKSERLLIHGEQVRRGEERRGEERRLRQRQSRRNAASSLSPKTHPLLQPPTTRSITPTHTLTHTGVSWLPGWLVMLSGKPAVLKETLT